MQMQAQNRFRRVFRRVREWVNDHDLWVVLSGLVLLLVLTFFWNNIVIAIRPGEAGVLWSRLFGTITDRVYPEGLHLILPWNVMTTYNVRYQTTDHDFLVLSRDGLEIGVEVSIRFKPLDKLVPKLHQQVGPGYIEAIVIPEVNAAVRTVIGRYRPDELYAASFQQIREDMLTLARSRVRNHFVFIDDILVRTIRLPDIVAGAIQRKLEQEQAALEMQYRLSRERQEADRKVVEATGIQEYQARVNSTLTAGILQFKSIEAALELSRSTNAKVIVLGGGSGVPIILNADGLVSTSTAVSGAGNDDAAASAPSRAPRSATPPATASPPSSVSPPTPAKPSVPPTAQSKEPITSPGS